DPRLPRRLHDLLLGPPLRRDPGSASFRAALPYLRAELDRAPDRPAPALGGGGAPRLARRPPGGPRARRGRPPRGPLDLASVRAADDDEGGLLREQRLLLLPRHAAGAPDRRASEPHAGRRLRPRARARVLADVADRSDRRPRYRLDDLEGAARAAPHLD